ncbi:MAG: type III pantothenate kinase [Deltaproteobacteria bacterium]|nr:type III pantothenate kinase [Deltaproteobacteria bacterium]
MLLVFDVGNTNTSIGIFDESHLLKNWRIRTVKNVTEDEFGILAFNLFALDAISPQDITKIVISCVVPPLVFILDSFCNKYLKQTPHRVNTASIAHMPVQYNNPSELGSDRIVNAVAAFSKYQTDLIVIDFGTATTFDCISRKGEYLGGAISPGIMTASEALFKKASKLPGIERFTPPESVIGKDTANCLKSGIVYGYASLVDGMVERMKEEMKTNPKIIATGGLAPLMYKISKATQSVDPFLTLEGLRIIAKGFK